MEFNTNLCMYVCGHVQYVCMYILVLSLVNLYVQVIPLIPYNDMFTVIARHSLEQRLFMHLAR